MQRTGAARASAEELAFVDAESYAIDDDAVYFGAPSEAGDVMLTRMKRDRTERVTLAPIKPFSSFALDRSSIYFNGLDGRVASLPKTGGTPVDSGFGDLSAGSLQVDDTHFYWVESTATDVVIKRRPKETTVAETLVSGIGGIAWMQQQGDSILLRANDTFFTVPKTGGCPQLIAFAPPTDADRFGSAAADEDAIYWLDVFFGSDSPSYKLWRAPRSGGAVVSVSSGSWQPGGITMALAPSVVVMKLDGMLQKFARH